MNFQIILYQSFEESDQIIHKIFIIKPYVKADPDADAADIVIELMELFGEYHAVLRIIIVDIKGKTRQTADSVIVYMSSAFHKKKATNYLPNKTNPGDKALATTPTKTDRPVFFAGYRVIVKRSVAKE